MYQSDKYLQSVLPLRKIDHILGAATAKVVLIEYGDFQCPQSNQVYRTVKELSQHLGAKLCFVFRHYPQLKIHPRAQIAAEAAEAAAAQNQFWSMSDLLFGHQGDFEDADLLEFAIALNLNIPWFLKDLADRVHAHRIQNDIATAQASGITQSSACVIGVRCQGTANLAETVMYLTTI